MRAVATKREKVERRVSERRRLEKFLGKRAIPAVRGPGGDLFMIDHHHLGLALWQADIETVYVAVLEDLSWLTPAAFWRRMEADGRLYPFDEAGHRIKPALLPSRLSGLRADPYRDLASSVRQAGGYDKVNRPYSEFAWADYYRERISDRLITRDYEAAVTKAVRMSRRRDAAHMPGYCGD